MFQGLIFCMTSCFLETNILIIFYVCFSFLFAGGWKLPGQSIDFQTEKWLHFCALLCFLVPIFWQIAPKIWHSQFHVSSSRTSDHWTVFSFAKVCSYLSCFFFGGDITYPAFTVSVCARIIVFLFHVLFICSWLDILSNLNEGIFLDKCYKEKEF